MKFGNKKYKCEHYWFVTFALRSEITQRNNKVTFKDNIWGYIY